MDAFAVTVANAVTLRPMRRADALWSAVYFGSFQFLMPLLGALLAGTVAGHMIRLGPFISFVLLGYIGGKMIWDAVRGEEESGEYPLTLRLLLTQGIATSIDALAVGVSFAALPDVNIWTSAILICCTTFAFSLVGVVFGKRVGTKLGSRAQLVGGIILVCIGLKIFIEHMFFAG